MGTQAKLGEKIAVNRRQMVDEILLKIGATGTCRLWELLEELRNEDSEDAAILRSLREAFMVNSDSAFAGFMVLLQSWDKPLNVGEDRVCDAGDALTKFYRTMQERTVFRFACNAADQLKGIDDLKRAKIHDAVATLRTFLEGTTLSVRVDETAIN
jgi:hypothetical protein